MIVTVCSSCAFFVSTIFFSFYGAKGGLKHCLDDLVRYATLILIFLSALARCQ